MSKRAKIIGSTLSIVIYLACIAFVIFSLLREIDFNNSKIIALLIGACALAKLCSYFLSYDFLKIPYASEGLINFVVLVLAVIFLFIDIHPSHVSNTFAIIDIVSSVVVSLSLLSMFKTNRDFFDLIVCVGDLVFGILLLMEGPKGLGVHLIFECSAMGLLIIERIIKIKKATHK